MRARSYQGEPNEPDGITSGWIGQQGQVHYYLSVVGADKDKDGRFIIVNGGAYTFLGLVGDREDIVIDGNACYLKDGHKCGLAAGLGSTSYGMRVQVIA